MTLESTLMPAPHEDYHLALPAGLRLDEFKIDRVLGSGGFGITYAATDTSLNRRVAIKEFFPSGFATRLNSDEVRAQEPRGAPKPNVL